MRLRLSRFVSTIVTICLLLGALASAQKTVHVKQYKKKDGTIVKAHDRKAPTKHATPQSTSTPAPTEAEATPTREAANNQTVYVTKSGNKYHLAGCRYLSKSATPLALSDAAIRYSPCSVCGAPRVK